ncbi:MAG TPA: PTS transporter subunit EIIC [Phytomonospora sp.]
MSATAAAGDGAKAKGGSAAFAFLQKFGRSLMLPIAVLPAAALLLRFGQPDMLGKDGLGAHWEWLLPVAKVLAAAGQVLFDNLPLLFAVGVSLGIAKKADGSTALAAVVGYLVFDRVTKAMFSESRIADQVMQNVVAADGSVSAKLNIGMMNPTGVLGGILIGIVAGLLWQKYHRIKLPQWLSFFGGRRFVPIVTAVTAMLLGVVFGWVWPVVGSWIAEFGDWVAQNGVVGAGVYGVINRLLLPMGLHHIINSIVWFTIPTCDVNGVVAHGDLNCYFAGQDGAGTFMAGWFPVLMFGIPGAALAMWRAARPANRAVVGGLMISGALTAFVCGITEPIEYSFIFVAPLLFGLHVLLSGVSLALVTALDIKIGFGFSAGLIDYLLNFSKSNTHRPLLLLLIGLVYFVIYFLVFYVVITKMNLPTPGREAEDEEAEAVNSS